MYNETLYLIKSRDKYGNFILKIGYTKNLESRMATYRTHNPSIELLDTCIGTRELEAHYHNYFKEYAYPGYPEWFYYTPEILTKFGTLEIREYCKIINFGEKIFKYFCPRPVENFVKIYQEKYNGEEYDEKYLIESMNCVRGLTITYLETLNFSDIPYVFYKDTRYFLSIPLPFIKENYVINLEQILDCLKSEEIPQKNTITLYVKARSTMEIAFQDLLSRRVSRSYELLEAFNKVSTSEKYSFARNHQMFCNSYCFKDNYISVNIRSDSDLDPFLNELMVLLELRAFEIQREDYIGQFATIDEEKNK